MIGIEEQAALFALIGRELKKRVECFVIGGSAMLFYGVKSATKDIDLVFLKEEERRHFIKILKKLGFESSLDKGFRHSEVSRIRPVLLQRGDTRFDLFFKEVISTRLSPGMVRRIKEKHEFSNLVTNIVSPEDIIILKCATDRAGDRKDAADIIQSREINWDTVVREAVWQTAHGRKIYTVFLFDFIMELKEDYKAEIPRDAVRKITKIYEEKMLEFVRRKGKNQG